MIYRIFGKNSIILPIGIPFVVAVLLMVVFYGCGSPENNAKNKSPASGNTTHLTAWAHHGKPEEWKTIQDQVERFNRSQKEVTITLIEIAEGNYDTQVQSAAVAGELPEILEFDGPMLANYVWKGYLKSLENVISSSTRSDLLPSIAEQCIYRGKLYSVGAFDSGLALYGNRQMLKKIDARIPNGIDDAWTIEEFNDILQQLSKQNKLQGKQGFSLDIKRDYKGEWWTYGFYPALISGGAGLIDLDDVPAADGTLNSPAAVAVLKHFQHWIQSGYIAPNTDGRAFIDKRVALSWVGHWEYPRYRKAIGDDLVLVPLPNFGNGTRTAMGSWCWGITRNCNNPEAAARFLEFLLSEHEVLAITRANGAVPGTKTAVDKSELYQSGAPLHLFTEQLRRCAEPRAKTPAYPVITSAFREAMLNILNGAGIENELDEAVRIIDENIKQNKGYPFPEK